MQTLVDSQYQAEVDSVSAAEWTELLGRFADANLYQTLSYGTVRWGKENLSHLVLRRNGEVVGMVQVRLIQRRLVPGGIAYVRWGPMCQLRGQEPDLETARQMVNALREEYARKRKLFLRVLPNAFAGTPRGEIFREAFAGFDTTSAGPETGDRTIVVDLSPPLDQLRKDLDQKWRNCLNRGERNSLRIVEGSRMEHYAMFLKLYDDMWQRKKFETTVDVGEFGKICEDLPASLALRILICEDKGVPVSGVVCTGMGDMGIYLLGATSEAGMKSQGAYVLHWEMMRWLKENGCRQYDLGGIDPENNPGVYKFKKGFSGADVTRLPAMDCCESLPSALLMKGADLAREKVLPMLKGT